MEQQVDMVLKARDIHGPKLGTRLTGIPTG
jgi:hypothetical protein